MKTSKIFLSITVWHRATKFGMKWHLKVLYQVCSNYAPRVKFDSAPGVTKWNICLYKAYFVKTLKIFLSITVWHTATGLLWSLTVRRPSVRLSVRPFTICKHLLLLNHWANFNQISCGASLGHGTKILLKKIWSHDQDGRHDHIW